MAMAMDPVEEMEFWRNLDRYLARLQDEDKNSRNSTLKTIYSQVERMDTLCSSYLLDNDPGARGECSNITPPDVLESQIAMFIRPILRCTSDISEKSREIAFDILGLIFDRMSVEHGLEHLPNIIPVLVEKFGQPQIKESCEEVRLSAFKFIQGLVSRVAYRIGPYVSDLSRICVNGILDSFQDIRIITCTIISALGKFGKQNFFPVAERLCDPLSRSVTHQQNRVRTAVINCMGDVVFYGNYKCFDAIIPAFTSRVFDSSINVRRALIEVVGNWLVDYNNRYACFHRMVPLLFCGFYDDAIEVSELAKRMWRQAGDKYLHENLEEYRDNADFPPPLGAGVTRPSTGCKLLVSQHIGKLLPAISKEITDWQVSTRLKSVQLLHCLIYNCEEKIVMHLPEIIDCLIKACVDENVHVKEYVVKSSELLGLHIPLPICWPFLSAEIEHISNTYRHYGGLKVSAAVLSNVNPLVVETFMSQIATLIAQKPVCQTNKEPNQYCLIEMCEVLLRSPEQASKIIHTELFYVLLALSALGKVQWIKKKAAELLRKLQFALKFNSIEELMGTYCGRVLQEMKRSCGEWTSETPDKLIFELIWLHGGLALENNWQTILDIMVINLAPKKDPKVRLDFFTKLSVQLSENREKSIASKEKLEQFLRAIVIDVLDPNMIWHAGETAQALRTAALGTAHAILSGDFMNPDILVELSSELITNMLSMIDEPMEVTRLLVCKSLRLIVHGCEKKLGVEMLHKIYPALLKRLDDAAVKVRESACKAIATIFMNTPPDYETQYKNHIEYVYSSLMPHLDDDDIKGHVLETLKKLGKLAPGCLIQECEKIRGKQRSPLMCDELLQSFGEMKLDAGIPVSIKEQR